MSSTNNNNMEKALFPSENNNQNKKHTPEEENKLFKKFIINKLFDFITL